MTRSPLHWLVAVALVSLSANSTFAQTFKFKLSQGQTLRYQRSQQTTVQVKNEDSEYETFVDVSLEKEWKVTNVDSDVATLELSFTKLRFEQTDPDGKKIFFDSEDQDASNAVIAGHLKKLVGVPIQRVQMKLNGEVTDSTVLVENSPVRQQVPFFVTFPEEELSKGHKWQTDWTITLPPETKVERPYEAIKTYEVTHHSDDQLIVSLKTTLQETPQKIQAKLALLQYVPEGTVTFDRAKNIMTSAVIVTKQTVPNYAGPNSNYAFESKLTEKLLD